MRVTCASKHLKQPIEFNIPDEQYEKIKKMPSETEQNKTIAAMAIKHVRKHGYDFGHCSERNKNVDFNFCINCGMKQGLNKPKWEKCKSDNINYNYKINDIPQQAMNKIKDVKLRSKLALTPEELKKANELYINTP